MIADVPVTCQSGLCLVRCVINISRCLNVTRKADWTFLNNLATFGGFLFSYFHRFTIGIPAQVIILGPFASQGAVTSIYGAKLEGQPPVIILTTNIKQISEQSSRHFNLALYSTASASHEDLKDKYFDIPANLHH